jgi:surfactin synthase thioesterase subunit
VLAVPDSRAEVISVTTLPGGHFLVDESPAEVVQLIDAHLSAQADVHP